MPTSAHRFEHVTLHFDLTHCNGASELTLHAHGGRYPLTAYRDAPDKLAAHVRVNRALALMGDDHRRRVTHFVEDLPVSAEAVGTYWVSYPSRDPSRLLPEIGLLYTHVPRTHVERVHRRLAAKRATIGLAALAHYGVDVNAVAAAELAQVRGGADSIKSAIETAKTIVFSHPEIGSKNPEVAAYIRDHWIAHARSFTALWQYIYHNGGGTAAPWYSETISTEPDGTTPLDLSTDLRDKDGHPIKWQQKNGRSVLPLYSLSGDPDAGDPARGGLLAMARPVVMEILQKIKDDPALNGHSWTVQHGVTARHREQTAVRAVPMAARVEAEVPGGLWALRNTSSGYGLNLYPDTLKAGDGTLSFEIRNWALRSLGVYLQYQKQGGDSIDFSGITKWKEQIGLSGLRSIVEPSAFKKYLQSLPPGNHIFGLPLGLVVASANDAVTITFPWPDDAHQANVLLGGAGIGSFDAEVDVPGICLTMLYGYTLPGIMIAFTVGMVGLMWVKDVLFDTGINLAVYSILGFLVAPKFAYQAIVQGDWKGVLTTFGGTLAGIIFKVGMEKLALRVTGMVTAQELIDNIPFVGFAVQIASIAATVANMAATTVEILISPSTYTLQVTRSMNLQVSVGFDPKHGEWPTEMAYYTIVVQYPKSGSSEGGTNPVLSGPRPAGSDRIAGAFNGIPAGGTFQISVNAYSATDWLCGQWQSASIAALPPAGQTTLTVRGDIKEVQVPLSADTQYSHLQKLGYTDHYLWQATRFTIGAALGADLDQNRVSDALRAAFAGHGVTLSAKTAATVLVAGNSWQIVDQGAGITYLVTTETFTVLGKSQTVLQVQNKTQPYPVATASSLAGGSEEHRIQSLVDITFSGDTNQIGYAWQASGTGLPTVAGGALPDQKTPLYAFQSISALADPQQAMLAPGIGFANATRIAFDQFGLQPLFSVPAAQCSADLDRGTIASALASQFAGLGVSLAGLTVTAKVKGADWLIGPPGGAPVYELRLVQDAGAAAVVSVFPYPVPTQTNFYLDPRTASQDGKYHLRAVRLSASGSAGTFEYTPDRSWGAFSVAPDALAVHPHGYAVGLSYGQHKMLLLKLPDQASADAAAPVAIPLSGEGLREGLLNGPVAMTVTADGRILVLEQGNARIQAFDTRANPVQCFASAVTFHLDGGFLSALDQATASIALIQAIQASVKPALAAVFALDAGEAPNLDSGTVDQALRDAFADAALTLSPTVNVHVTTRGQVWTLEDTGSLTNYEIRRDDQTTPAVLDVFRAPILEISVRGRGTSWLVRDKVNTRTYSVSRNTGTGVITATQLIATMSLWDDQALPVEYLDIAAETKGYIYCLSHVKPSDRDLKPSDYRLDIYSPEGTHLTRTPDKYGNSYVSAARCTVDQWRNLYTLNYEALLGQRQRTEPTISTWIPSTPKGEGK